jgi:DNA segregation ATPase FtsK/SpoIIIE-like protein
MPSSSVHSSGLEAGDNPEAGPTEPAAYENENGTAEIPAYDGATQVPLFEEIEAMKSTEARDALFDEAVRVVGESGRGSVSLLQRRLRIGYSRASRLVDQLEEAGIVGPDRGGSLGREYLGGDSGSEQADDTPARIIGEADDGSNSAPRIWM